ncbi:MAG: lysoplasmalogenase [Saprospiraceae bacterium]|nr:lysoplasmalogenase [Saprospiraceae bacterium]
MKVKNYYILFWVFALLHIFSEWNEFKWLEMVTKPLLVGMLIWIFYIQSGLKHPFDKKIFAGLIWSWLGDIALMFVSYRSGFFLIGLFSFLIAHIAYSFAFAEDIRFPSVNRPVWAISFSIAFFTTHALFLFFILYPGLGNMVVPVILYTLVISLMAVLAWSRIGSVNSSSFWSIAAGAWLFVISDSVLAIDKFAFSLPKAGVIIILTYIFAQYLITTGSLKRQVHEG